MPQPALTEKLISTWFHQSLQTEKQESLDQTVDLFDQNVESY
jgi:hypothetical protein